MESADDIQEVIKDLLGGPIKSMMKSKIDEYLGYESYERILGQIEEVYGFEFLVPSIQNGGGTLTCLTA